MGIPQIIYIVLTIAGLIMFARKHGTTDVKKHDFWASIIAYSFVFSIYYFGGFFDNGFGIPQTIIVVLNGVDLVLEILDHDTTYEKHYNLFTCLPGSIIQAALLYWGGFFG